MRRRGGFKVIITGSIVALVTPMTENGDIDQSALERLVDWHLEAGTAGIVAVGTTGESATLNVEEHCYTISQVVSFVSGRIPVIAGTGANSTSEAIELTRLATDVGATACLLVTPYYNRPSQRGLVEHFKKVSTAVDCPQILYNVPTRTAVDMTNETVLELASIDNIVGIKDATGDLERGSALLEEVPDNFAVYSGDDATAADLILAGGHGNISVTANVIPSPMADLVESALTGDVEQCNRLSQKMSTLNSALFLEANPIPVKWALAQMGMISSGIRLPLTTLDDAFHEPLRVALKNYGIHI